MAVYHDNLTYHEDSVKKHLMTKDEADFLEKLQLELNTQDHINQADPRFWVIKGSEKEYGIESGYEDGADLIQEESLEVVATDIPSAMEYIKEHLLEKINDCDGVQRTLELERGIFHKNLVMKWMDEDLENSVEFDNMEEICEWLKEQGYDYRVSNYKIRSIIYPDTMFLTQKDAEDHLRLNYYHYSDDAYTYAMTAWRSPVVEKLVKMLQEVDFVNSRRKATEINPEFEKALGWKV